MEIISFLLETIKDSIFPVIFISLVSFHRRKQDTKHKNIIVFHLILHFVTVNCTFGLFTQLFFWSKLVNVLQSHICSHLGFVLLIGNL